MSVSKQMERWRSSSTLVFLVLKEEKKKSLLISILITAHLALNPEAGAPNLANKEFLQGSVAHPTGQNNKSRPSQVLSSRSQTWGHLFQPLPTPATSPLVTESYCPQDSLGPAHVCLLQGLA